ncbi:MAG: MFS transporter [Verrucomicrobia subdivision 3 bacterium]|nr:MFS transporter [Limisphaerales bacterium]
MSDATPKNPLANKGFLSLVVTQFLGAGNDYLLKQVLTFGLAAAGIWNSTLGDGGQSYVAAVLALPFLLFSAVAGQLCDRYSKQLVAVRVKQAEFLIVLAAFAGFYFNNVYLCLFAMFLLGTQSAFFGPAKYGVIPELVDASKISMANGIINMLTNVAVIAATLVAGAIYEAYRGPDGVAAPVGLVWLPGVALLCVAIVGLIAALQMPKLKASAETLKVKWEFFAPHLRTIRRMRKGDSPVFMVCLLKGGFGMLAFMFLLILADYTVVLGLPETKVGVYLLGTIGVAIGVGSISAGLISRNGIQPRLIPAGAIGLVVASLLLAWAPSSYMVIHRADTATAEKGLAGLPEGITVSHHLDRAEDRLAELRSDLEFEREGSISLSERMERVENGEVGAMVISSAYLDTFENKKKRARKIDDQTKTIGYYELQRDGKPTGLVATAVEARKADIWRVVGYLFIVGVCAGLYVIPLQALIQKLSPNDSRGQYIGASNAVDAVFEISGTGLFFLMRQLGVGSQEIFFSTAAIALFTVGLFYWRIRAHIHKTEWR